MMIVVALSGNRRSRRQSSGACRSWESARRARNGFAQCLALIPGRADRARQSWLGFLQGDERDRRPVFISAVDACHRCQRFVGIERRPHRLPHGSLTTLAVGTIISGIVG